MAPLDARAMPTQDKDTQLAQLSEQMSSLEAQLKALDIEKSKQLIIKKFDDDNANRFNILRDKRAVSNEFKIFILFQILN
jgi:hypothetical protein